MTAGGLAIIELLLVVVVVLGWALWQWWDWRQWRREQRRRLKTAAAPPACPGSAAETVAVVHTPHGNRLTDEPSATTAQREAESGASPPARS